MEINLKFELPQVQQNIKRCQEEQKKLQLFVIVATKNRSTELRLG